MSKQWYLIIAIGLLISSCQRKNREDKNRISIKGSDTMVNLTQSWAEAYGNEHPDVFIQVTGGGSGTGIAALLNGTVDIANISRELKDSEIEKAKSLGITPYKTEVALDGIAVVVNKNNPLDTLTYKQLRDIYAGKIRNWSALGGPDRTIILYERDNSSGTHEFFRNKVLSNRDNDIQYRYSPYTQVLPGTAALAEAVSKDVNGIGYGGVGYFVIRKDLKVLYIKEEPDSGAISPVISGRINYNAVWSGSYPFARPLYCYTNGKPGGIVKDYLDFITSNEGQKIVALIGYIPLSKEFIGVNQPQ